MPVESAAMWGVGGGWRDSRGGERAGMGGGEGGSAAMQSSPPHSSKPGKVESFRS